jgi:RNA polymerase sigma factor (sigma-70 family)
VVDFLRDQLNTLLAAAKLGDQDAFNRLTEVYSPLIRSMSARFVASLSAQNDAGLIDIQDLEQEARLALFRAVTTYDGEQKKVSFGLYAKICIRNALVSQLRRAKSRRARAAREREQASAGGDAGLPFALADADSGELEGRIRGVLSPFENRIFEQYVSGRSVRDIAASEGRTEKSVSNAVYRVRVKIKGLLKP